jgi:uncharacterized repeat protein (TIGR01451 family)
MRLTLSFRCLLGCLILGVGLTAFELSKTWAAQNEQPSGNRTAVDVSAKQPVRKADQSDLYREKRAPQPGGDIPAERYLKAQKQIDAMGRYSTAEDRVLPSRNAMPGSAADERLGTWVSLGPGNLGGRARAFQIHPTDPNIMYLAGVAGGVWKTTNGGGTWTALTDLLPNLAVASLAMDPKNPNVLYAGTGEGFGNLDAHRGIGIYKTVDGGVTWAHLAATLTADFHYVNDLVISPNDSQRIYAATHTGVWRSINGGTSWTQTYDATESYGALDLVIRTDRTTDYVFAACGSFEQSAIYRNVQAENTQDWVQVLTEPEMGRTSLALAPSNQNVLYASSVSTLPERDGALHAIFRSNSSGDPGTWTAPRRHDGVVDLNTALMTNVYYQFNMRCRGFERSTYSQGWHTNAIAVDPLDPEKVWFGSVDLFRSDDGGVTWGLAEYWWAPASTLKATHTDQHVIAFHPQYNGTTNQQMFIVNDGGIQRTGNARATVAKGDRAPCDSNLSQITWTSLNNNLNITQFHHGTVYPNGTAYLGGTQNNGTVYGTEARGVNGWDDLSSANGGYVAVDPNNPNTLYAEYNELSLYKTTNNGSLWYDATVGITEGSNNFQYVAPFTMDPSAARRLWIGGRTLWRTKDKADFWTAASTQLVDEVTAIGVSPKNGNRVLAGVRSGNIYRSDTALTTDAATNWQNVRPRLGYVSWLTWDPVDANVAYATYSSFNALASDKHIYKTTNGGLTWTAIDGTGTTGIPDIPVHCLLVDPRQTNVLYVGTDLGVFVSTDGGANWLVENTGFANAVTESLSFNSSNGVSHLYAFTYGRSAYKVRLSGKSAPEIVFAVTPSATPLVTNAVTVTVTVRATGGRPTGKVTFRDNFNDETVRTLDTFDLDANGQARITFPANSLPAGWHYLSVDYSGDTVYNPVRSNELELNVLSNVVDLSLRKAVNGVMGNGGTSIYSLIVRNQGNAPNTGAITVVDTLPAGLTFISHTGTNWSCGAQGQIVTCTFSGTLNANAENTVRLSVRVGPEAVPRVVNIATCSTPGEANVANNQASLTSEVKPTLPIDLTLSKSHIGVFVRGANATYNLTVRNVGTVPTNTTVTVQDTLPVGFTFVSNTGTGWTCGGNNATPQVVTCTNPNVIPLLTGSSAFTITVAVGSTAPDAPVNRACVIHPGDINAANDCSNDGATVRAGVDLEMRKSHAGDFGQGGTGVYSLSVKNASVVASTGTITVTDTLPAAMTYASYTGIGWTCSAVGQTVTCTNSNSIAPLATSVIFLTVNVAANAPAQLINTAVCSNANDVYTANNTSSDTTRIVARTDLAVSVAAADNPAVAGAPLTYTATVRNGTANPANAVDVTVTLPTGVSPKTVNPPTGWTVSLTGNSVKFSRTTMAGNEVGILPIITSTNPAITEGVTLSTSVRVVSTTSDVITNNNQATTATRFVTRADLSAALRVDGRNPALEADLLTYTLTTTNAGPSVALAVVAASKLSPGLVITECTPLVSGTCTPTADGVNVTYPSLNAEAVATVRIVAKVVGAQVQGATLTHNVNVSTTTTDQNLTNNIATVSVAAAAAQMQLTIDGGKTQFDFAALAAMRELATTLPSQLFSVKNLGVAPLDLNLSARRTGTEVTSGKITNADDSATFPVYLLPEATGSETVITAPVKVNGGVTRRFRLVYQPLLPVTVNRITNLAAAEVIPENMTSRSRPCNS